MTIPARIADLSPEQFHKIVHNAMAQAIADQTPEPAILDVSRTANAVEAIAKNGLKVRSGVAAGVFAGLLAWSILPAVLVFVALTAGLLAR